MVTLNFKGHSVEVETHGQEFTAPVVRVKNKNSYWYTAYLANGEHTDFILEKVEDSFPLINCLLKYKGNEVYVLLEDEEFPNSEVVSIDFNKRCSAATFATGEVINFRFFNYEDSIPFRDNFPLEKYQTAKAAKDKVKKAISLYHQEMEELGARHCEHHEWDEYESWLDIPGIPNYKWETY